MWKGIWHGHYSMILNGTLATMRSLDFSMWILLTPREREHQKNLQSGTGNLPFLSWSPCHIFSKRGCADTIAKSSKVLVSTMTPIWPCLGKVTVGICVYFVLLFALKRSYTLIKQIWIDKYILLPVTFYRNLVANNGFTATSGIPYENEFLHGQFPEGFIWSTATAAYQVEGGWNADGMCSLVDESKLLSNSCLLMSNRFTRIIL